MTRLRGQLPGSRRRALGGLLTVVLLSACSTGTSSPATASLTASGSASSGPSSGSSAALPGTASTPGKQLTLVVSGDRVTGDTGVVKLGVDEPVRLTVTSDVADEVHVHGAGGADGIGKDVEAGGSVTIEFTEPAPGRFEVELEKAKRTLTLLQVS